MNTLLLLMSFLLLLPGLGFGGIDADIPQTNQVILASGQWKPSAEQTQKALAAIQSFLDNRGPTNNWWSGGIEGIMANTKLYRVQFMGVSLEGKKLIWCNFFMVLAFGNRVPFPDWKHEVVDFDDGGFAFWQIYFDPSTGKCTRLWINETG